MKSIKANLNKLIYLPGWLTAILTVVSTVGLIYVFLKEKENSITAYIIYPVSAYTLSSISVQLVKKIPIWYKNIIKKVYKKPLGKRYLTDAVFRIRVSLNFSLAINIIYSTFKLTFGLYYSSAWWVATGVYYTLLAILRFVLIRYMRRDNEKQGLVYEYKCYKLCGILMLVLNLSLSGMVVQMVWQNKGSAYPGFTIFAVAAYTFYAVFSSATDIIKYRKKKSPVLEASKLIRLAAALVSLLSLETDMLVQFGNDETFRRVMIACTGAGVCVIVLGISVYMITQANKNIKENAIGTN